MVQDLERGLRWNIVTRRNGKTAHSTQRSATALFALPAVRLFTATAERNKEVYPNRAKKKLLFCFGAGKMWAYL